jgi:hypothetical protein
MNSNELTTPLPTIVLDDETLALLDVCDAARAGDPVADRALRTAALAHLSAGREMPALIAEYVMQILHAGPPPWVRK